MKNQRDGKADLSDAFGAELMDFLNGVEGTEIVERDDGYIDATSGPGIYFAEHADWHRQERQVMRHVRGRVLDIGVGGGRHALYLQENGHKVVGIDTSPGALEVCRRRGLTDVHALPITRLSQARLGRFDTLLMLGNNFGLFANKERARRLLRSFLKLTNPGARILAQCLDPYQTANPRHLLYHKQNKAKGRMGGQLRIRVRYKAHCTPWFDYLFVSPVEMMEIVKDTGWWAERFTRPEDGMYTTIIQRKK